MALCEAASSGREVIRRSRGIFCYIVQLQALCQLLFMFPMIKSLSTPSFHPVLQWLVFSTWNSYRNPRLPGQNPCHATETLVSYHYPISRSIFHPVLASSGRLVVYLDFDSA